jgi:hypothetical protein
MSGLKKISAIFFLVFSMTLKGYYVIKKKMFFSGNFLGILKFFLTVE